MDKKVEIKIPSFGDFYSHPPRHCVTPLPAGAERPGVGGELATVFKFSSLGGVRRSREVGCHCPRGGRNAPASEGTVPPLSLMPAMGATRDFYSCPTIILLLNFFGVSNRINIELTGMSVRALEKPNSFGANAS